MDISPEELASYYDALPDPYGRDALCKMQLPLELSRKTVIDVACRRGKGVYKLSERVGKHGTAIGVEWRPALLEAARTGEEHAAQKCGYEQSNMQFVECYPEQLADVLGEHKADFVYVNSIINLFCNPAQALAQINRALKPGGLLVCDTVLATGPRNASVVERARKLGNAVQAAPHRKDLMGWLASAGFDVTTVDAVSDERVDVSADADGNLVVPVAPSDEPISFVATNVRVFACDAVDYHAKDLMKDISKFR